jgi:hypothetical protein
MSEVGKQTCFVIMPFSRTIGAHDESYWTTHFERYLTPIIEEDGKLTAIRSEALRGNILNEIIRQLVTAPVVVADLTDANRNVYWELGVRQSFKHGTVTIAEEGTDLPFDLGAKGTLFYSSERVKHVEFSRKFKRALADCLEHPERPDSHVLEAISGRGSLFQIFRKDETIRRLEALESENEYNLLIIEMVRVDSEKNLKKIPDEKLMVTNRFRMSAMELLITDRYIEEKAEFYELAEDCYDSAIKLNDKLNEWLHFADRTDTWISNHGSRHAEHFANFKQKITEAREKVRRLT